MLEHANKRRTDGRTYNEQTTDAGGIWYINSSNVSYKVIRITTCRKVLQRLDGFRQNFVFALPVAISCREHSGSVVECLTQDRRAAGSSLTGVNALWSLSKIHLS